MQKPETKPNPVEQLRTPEVSVAFFFTAWKERMFEHMLLACTRTWRARPEAIHQTLAAWFGSKTLIEYGPVTRLPRTAEQQHLPGRFMVDFRVPIRYRHEGAEYKKVALVRVISERAAHSPSIAMGSYWGVNPLSALREEEEEEHDATG